MKNSIFCSLFLFISMIVYSQSQEYQLSSHILDISRGLPAEGVTIKLERLNEKTNAFTFVDEKKTDKNGRIASFLSAEKDNGGIYKLTYFTADYFRANKTESFYPFIEVVFQIKDKTHYHVPITLSAFGYSTYRGN
ncbi:MAG: hydroxyisourate hydrolase [Flavobacterium sp.]|nr:MAG: hydroxyisourate hydrolase [Flavobacterium sp.]